MALPVATLAVSRFLPYVPRVLCCLPALEMAWKGLSDLWDAPTDGKLTSLTWYDFTNEGCNSGVIPLANLVGALAFGLAAFDLVPHISKIAMVVFTLYASYKYHVEDKPDEELYTSTCVLGWCGYNAAQKTYTIALESFSSSLRTALTVTFLTLFVGAVGYQVSPQTSLRARPTIDFLRNLVF